MKNTKKIEFKPLTPIDGNRSEAVNVRRRGDWMEVTGTPAAVCPKTTDDRFLGADRRGSRTYYFMQRNGKDVIMSGYRQDGTFFSPFYGNPDTLRFIFAEKHKSNEKHKKD